MILPYESILTKIFGNLPRLLSKNIKEHTLKTIEIIEKKCFPKKKKEGDNRYLAIFKIFFSVKGENCFVNYLKKSGEKVLYKQKSCPEN